MQTSSLCSCQSPTVSRFLALNAMCVRSKALSPYPRSSDIASYLIFHVVSGKENTERLKTGKKEKILMDEEPGFIIAAAGPETTPNANIFVQVIGIIDNLFPHPILGNLLLPRYLTIVVVVIG